MLDNYRNLCRQTPKAEWVLNAFIGGFLGPAIYSAIIFIGTHFKGSIFDKLLMLGLPSLITMALIYPYVRNDVIGQTLTKRLVGKLALKYAFRSFYITVLIFAFLNLLIMPSLALITIMMGAISFFFMLVPLFLFWVLYLVCLNKLIKV